MTENIGHTLAANHQLQANFKSLSSTHDNILEQIETMFKEIKQNISSVSSSNKKCATDLKTTMGALFDTSSADSSMAIEKAAKLAATAAVETIITTTTTTATTAAASIAESIDCSLPKLINELRDDLVDANSTLAFTVKAQMEEMAKALSAPKPCSSDPIAMNNLETELLNCEPVPSWRMLGSKRIWKRDWSEYDAKMRSRRHQEKNEEKARRRRKRRRTLHNECNSKRIGSDKQLLANAKVQFSKPSSNTDPPIAALSVPKFIDFKKGETINPYRAETLRQPTDTAPTEIHQSASSSLHEQQQQWQQARAATPPPQQQQQQQQLDPMRPPIVRLTEQSAAGDQRFLKARLRDPKIMDLVRTYLSYLHDQPVCIRGNTKTSAAVMLAAEGLPADIFHLREVFLSVHEELGIPRDDAMADLQSHRAFLSSERIQRLQNARDAAHKFSHPINFQRR